MPAKKQPSADANQTPKILEVGTSVALNGNVQVKKFDIKAGYHFGITEKWDVSTLSEDEAEEFEQERLVLLKDRLDPFAQAEFDVLWAQRVEADKNGGD